MAEHFAATPLDICMYAIPPDLDSEEEELVRYQLRDRAMSEIMAPWSLEYRLLVLPYYLAFVTNFQEFITSELERMDIQPWNPEVDPEVTTLKFAEKELGVFIEQLEEIIELQQGLHRL